MKNSANKKLMQNKKLIETLYEIGCIKLGNFTLKSGASSNIYIDLRVLISYPQILKEVSSQLWKQVKDGDKIDLICGVPLAALSYATLISTESNIPMVMVRKEQKDHGTKKLIEGDYLSVKKKKEKSELSLLIVEDVITSGTSILEVNDIVTKKFKENSGVSFKIGAISVILDRESNGTDNLKKNGVDAKVYSLLKLSEINEVLKDKLKEIPKTVESKKKKIEKEKSFKERIELSKNPLAKKLFEIMEEKKTNLCVSADVLTKKELLDLINDVGSEICMLKTHIDVISDFDNELPELLSKLAKKHNFLLFEDRKFSDIGEIVQRQYHGGIYKISKWSDIITVHLTSGPLIVKSLSNENSKNGQLLIAKMSTSGTQTNDETINEALTVAQKNRHLITGFICQGRFNDEELGFIYCTPGVSIESKGDSLGQQYNTPEKIVGKNKSDVIIVGRGIYQQKDRQKIAREYRTRAWKSYLERLK